MADNQIEGCDIHDNGYGAVTPDPAGACRGRPFPGMIALAAPPATAAGSVESRRSDGAQLLPRTRVDRLTHIVPLGRGLGGSVIS